MIIGSLIDRVDVGEGYNIVICFQPAADRLLGAAV